MASLKEIFINKANCIHNYKYDYSLIDYINCNTIVVIICPIHGAFKVSPAKHINSKQGCLECKKALKFLTTEKFIIKSNSIHNNKYDYSKTKYTGYRNKVIIICRFHGEFQQTASDHLQGRGCQECGKGYFNTELFIKKSQLMHKNYYLGK